MTAIRTALCHRVQVSRSGTVDVDGISTRTWAIVAEEVPALVDSLRAEFVPERSEGEQAAADRAALVFALPSAPIQPGDRLTVTSGPSGRYTVEHGDRIAALPVGVSHIEWRCERVLS